jgi:hypothetical protein
MSYSYIKSVFPNFETSNDAVSFNSLMQMSNGSSTEHKTEAGSFVTGYDPASQIPENETQETFINSVPILPEKAKILSNTKINKAVRNDNLQFYNKPIKQVEQFDENPRNDKLQFYNKPIKQVEQFDENPKNLPCDPHIQHILACPECKAIVAKQLSLQQDKNRNEEIMEMVSYVLFGIFVLMLIESLQKRR